MISCGLGAVRKGIARHSPRSEAASSRRNTTISAECVHGASASSITCLRVLLPDRGMLLIHRCRVNVETAMKESQMWNRRAPASRRVDEIHRLSRATFLDLADRCKTGFLYRCHSRCHRTMRVTTTSTDMVTYTAPETVDLPSAGNYVITLRVLRSPGTLPPGHGMVQLVRVAPSGHRLVYIFLDFGGIRLFCRRVCCIFGATTGTTS
jgi:hypothetical protein